MNDIENLPLLKTKEDLYKMKNGERFKFVCKNCGKIATACIYNKNWIESKYSRFLCSPCAREDTNVKLYGTSNVFASKYFEDHMIDKFGKKCILGNKEVIEKRKHTMKERYGVDNTSPFAVKAFRDKSDQTKIERHGDKNYNNREKAAATSIKRHGVVSYNNREKFTETMNEKYGVSNAMELPEVQEKFRKTMIDRHGVPYSGLSESITEKVKKTNLKRYGSEYVITSDEVRKRISESLNKKFGRPYYLHSEGFVDKMLEDHGTRNSLTRRFSYDGESFDSSWELAVWIYYTETKEKEISRRNVPFFSLGEYGFPNKYYYPDFIIGDKIVEVKGGQFFDETGSMINPYNRDDDSLFEAKRRCAIDNGIEIWTGEEIKPFLEYVDKKYGLDYLKLFSVKLSFPYVNEDFSDKSDYGLIRHFHKSIYDAKVPGKLSPKEAWSRIDLRKKAALNRITESKRSNIKNKAWLSPNSILQAFNVAKIAPKVSVFRPELAKRLIAQYLSDALVIFDPFSGFSGRMLGAIRNGKSYVGQDINQDHITESRAILNYLGINNCSVSNLNSLFTTGYYDCLFTCPPYGDKEDWGNGTVSYICDEWIDVCLTNFRCRKYLFVVDKTEKYSNHIIETIEKKQFLTGKSTYEYVVLFDYTYAYKIAMNNFLNPVFRWNYSLNNSKGVTPLELTEDNLIKDESLGISYVRNNSVGITPFDLK